MTTDNTRQPAQTTLGKAWPWLLKASILLLFSALVAMVIVAIATGNLAYATVIGCRIGISGLIVAVLALLAMTPGKAPGAVSRK